jgi:hypothetical protein
VNQFPESMFHTLLHGVKDLQKKNCLVHELVMSEPTRELIEKQLMRRRSYARAHGTIGLHIWSLTIDGMKIPLKIDPEVPYRQVDMKGSGQFAEAGRGRLKLAEN